MFRPTPLHLHFEYDYTSLKCSIFLEKRGFHRLWPEVTIPHRQALFSPDLKAVLSAKVEIQSLLLIS